MTFLNQMNNYEHTYINYYVIGLLTKLFDEELDWFQAVFEAHIHEQSSNMAWN